MKNSLFKRSICYIFCLVLLLSSFSLPAFQDVSLFEPTTASAASSKPGKVKGLKAKSGVFTVLLSWKKVSGASGYDVCCYDTAKKKYISVSQVKKTTAGIKKLSSATTYRFAVRAYKKSGSKKIYGSFSSPVMTATKPKKVTGLTAVKTFDSVTLQWNRTKKATGYIVYRYDTAKKQYIRVLKTKSNTAVIGNLKSGTAYYYAVKAYLKSDKTYCYSKLSDRFKVRTLDGSLKTAKYYQMIHGGTYLIDAQMKEGNSQALPSTIAVKGDDVVVKAQAEGISMRVIYYGKSKQTYAVVDSMNIYFPMSTEEIGQNLDSAQISNTYAPQISGSVKTGTKTIDSKTYTYESFKTADSGRIIYYYIGSELKRIDLKMSGEDTMQVTVNQFTSTVSNSLFTIPKYYLKVDISKLS